jgi:hypothetical protein
VNTSGSPGISYLFSFVRRLIGLCGLLRFLAREFAFDDEAEQRQQQEMEEASAEEKELWVGPFLPFRPVTLAHLI